MYNKLSLIIIVSLNLMLLRLAHAQDTATTKRVRIQDVYVLPGILSATSTYGTLEDFRKLAPESDLLKNDMSEFTQAVSAYGITGNSAYSMMLGLHFRNKGKRGIRKNPVLRLGVSYYYTSNLFGGLYKEDKKPYDTLTSSQTGQMIYLDSITTTQYSMHYSSTQLQLDASLIFRTNPDARWSVYSGVGLTAGYTINAWTSVFHDVYGSTETYYPDGNVGYNYAYGGIKSHKAERFTNKNGFASSVSVPLGVDFRMGKKREFWKMLHLFSELKPGIYLMSIPELRNYVKPIVLMGVGARVSWN